MQELSYYSISGWFLIGLTTGIGPCISHHFLIVLPYIGLNKKGKVQGFFAVLYFSLARIITLTILGLLAGLIGGAFHQKVFGPGLGYVFQFILGFFLLFLSVLILVFDTSVFCKWTKKLFDRIPGDAMLIIGFLTPLMPCPILLGLIAYTAASGRYIHGAFSGLAFGIGTSLSPLLVAGPLFGLLKNRLSSRFAEIITNLGGILLFGYGLHLLLGIIM